MQAPAKTKITQPFGYDPSYPVNNGWHRGTDFSSSPDKTVYMPEDGTVLYRTLNGNDGNAIYITVGNRVHALCHLERNLVGTNTFQKQGTPIGIMGQTGAAIGVHLHWAVKVNGVFVDPMTLIGEKKVIITPQISKILQHGILARNGVAGRAYALDDPDAGAPWVGGELTEAFLLEIFNSAEARQWRDSEDPDSVKGINRRLANPPSNCNHKKITEFYINE